MNERALVAGQAVKLRLIARGDPGKKEILVPGPVGFPNHTPDIDAAAGGFGALAKGMENTHKKSNPKFETRNSKQARRS
jgi:hypothetical protein